MAHKPKLYWEILDKKALTLLTKLKFLKDAGFYLAGGTALALQIGHRKSADFDFYNPSKFDSAKIYNTFQTQKPKNLLLYTFSEDTLILEINHIGISLFTYNYPILKPFVMSEYLSLASLEDIAAMKLIAIIQRGIKRDFVDLYYLAQELKLENIMYLTKRKYAGFNRYLAYQALVYFKDAEEKQTRETKMLKSIDWETIKEYFVAEVANLKRRWRQNEGQSKDP